MNTKNFNFENGHALRVVEQLANETAWFVAKDVCTILAISDVRQAVERLDDDEKLMGKLYLSGQDRDTWTVNESGLYSLILTSNKPEAKAFKRWITHDVLPSIRKAGRYSTDDLKQREETMQRLLFEIEGIESEIKVEKASISDKVTSLKKKQGELRNLLKADIRQLKLDL